MTEAPIKIFAGNSNPTLAREVADYVGVPLGKMSVGRFSDGEITLCIDESVRGQHAYVLQSTCTPANEHIMELLVIIDALKRASASDVTVLLPYYGYARQDRKTAPREPITAKLIADLLEKAGATRIISLELHAAQIQGFFNVPYDHLYASPIFIGDIRKQFASTNDTLKDVVVVSPDAGGVERARAFAKKLHTSLAIIDKRRPKPGIAEIMNIIGDVQGKKALIIDDMVDTAGTLTKAAEALLKRGASGVWAYASHAVFSGPAIDRINASVIEEVVVTNTIPLTEQASNSPKIRQLSCAPLVGEAIKRVHSSDSISTLFL